MLIRALILAAATASCVSVAVIEEPRAPTAETRKPTAKCRDGSFSYSKHRSGTCSSHGGVQEWMTDASE